MKKLFYLIGFLTFAGAGGYILYKFLPWCLMEFTTPYSYGYQFESWTAVGLWAVFSLGSSALYFYGLHLLAKAVDAVELIEEVETV